MRASSDHGRSRIVRLVSQVPPLEVDDTLFDSVMHKSGVAEAFEGESRRKLPSDSRVESVWANCSISSPGDCGRRWPSTAWRRPKEGTAPHAVVDQKAEEALLSVTVTTDQGQSLTVDLDVVGGGAGEAAA